MIVFIDNNNLKICVFVYRSFRLFWIFCFANTFWLWIIYRFSPKWDLKWLNAISIRYENTNEFGHKIYLIHSSNNSTIHLKFIAHALQIRIKWILYIHISCCKVLQIRWILGKKNKRKTSFFAHVNFKNYFNLIQWKLGHWKQLKISSSLTFNHCMFDWKTINCQRKYWSWYWCCFVIIITLY